MTSADDFTDPDEPLIVLSTFPTEAAAGTFARRLLELRLAACVQAEPIRSWYRWEGEIQDDRESRVWIKTTARCYEDIERLVAAEHPYDEPQLVTVPVSGGSPGYLAWLHDAVD